MITQDSREADRYKLDPDEVKQLIARLPEDLDAVVKLVEHYQFLVHKCLHDFKTNALDNPEMFSEGIEGLWQGLLANKGGLSKWILNYVHNAERLSENRPYSLTNDLAGEDYDVAESDDDNFIGRKKFAKTPKARRQELMSREDRDFFSSPFMRDEKPDEPRFPPGCSSRGTRRNYSDPAENN